MKVTFIRPRMMVGVPEDALEPLVFALLSGLTSPKIDRVFYDDRKEKIPFDEPTDLVALSVETPTAKRAYKIALEYRKRRVPVIMGGHHPTLLPQEVLQFADSVVIGDAEGVWDDVINDAKNQQLKKVYENRYPSLVGLHFDRSIFKGKRYYPLRMVQFGRGCRFTCDYCSVHAFYGGNVRHRPVDEVVDEIKSLKQKFIYFTDDNLFSDINLAKELMKEIKPLGISWGCQAGLNIARDRTLVRLMAQSGCASVFIGFESIDEDNLKQMGKTWMGAFSEFNELINTFRENGIMIFGSFMFGYDYDTVDSFERTLDFTIQSKLFVAMFQMIAPFPGTPLYQRFQAEDRLVNDPWWLHPDFRYGQSWIKPAQMTEEELAKGCYETRAGFYKYKSILWRATDFKANFSSIRKAIVFILLNLISKREIHRKHGRLLGDDIDFRTYVDR